MARLNEPPLLSSQTPSTSSQASSATITNNTSAVSATSSTAPPPPSSESFEALKRRFIRQNRDLARTNSSQSLRIRNLEIEISRLLAENVTLREQAINLEHELEKRIQSAGVVQEVKRLKMVLEGKVEELSRVLGEGLGSLVEGKRAGNEGLFGTKEEREREANLIRQQQREWRLQQQAQETARLPPITEDSKWPRRTLSGDGLLATRSRESNGIDMADSPDLGPPPVAQFDTVMQTDPIKFDRSPDPTISKPETKRHEQEEDTEASAMLNMTSNLERRRRRRVSSLLEDMAAASDDQAAPPQSPSKATVVDRDQSEGLTTSKQNVKTAESTRLKAPPVSSTKRPSSTTASITARTAKENQNLESKMKALSVSDKENKVQGSASERDIPTRRPLGTKSTNSPTKPRRTMSDKVSSLKEEVAKTTQIKEQQRRDRKVKPLRFEPDDAQEQNAIKEKPGPVISTQQPKTPAPSSLDLFSPSLSTDPDDPPSTARSTTQTSEMACTTASLEEIVSSSTTSSSANGRGSRRSRPTVSYAEPNLRDKMRRPGKQLVDAVAATHREGTTAMKREGSVESNNASSHDQPKGLGQMRTVTIKRETPQHETSTAAWKNLPRATTADQDEHGEESKSPLVGKIGRSASSTFSKQRNGTTDGADTTAATAATSPLRRLSIYDGPSSSPSTTPREENDAIANSQPRSTKIVSRDRPQRRHSTTAAAVQISSSVSASTKTIPNAAASRKRRFDEASDENGHNNNINHDRPAGGVVNETREPKTGATERKVVGLKTPSATGPFNNNNSTNGARRRSMMV